MAFARVTGGDFLLIKGNHPCRKFDSKWWKKVSVYKIRLKMDPKGLAIDEKGQRIDEKG